jgi:hypothetical protein
MIYRTLHSQHITDCLIEMTAWAGLTVVSFNKLTTYIFSNINVNKMRWMIHIHSDWFIVYILRLLIFFLSSVLFVFVLCLLSNVTSFSGLYVVSSL